MLRQQSLAEALLGVKILPATSLKASTVDRKKIIDVLSASMKHSSTIVMTCCATDWA